MEPTNSKYKDLLKSLLSCPPLPFDERLHASLPEKGGVYHIFEKESKKSVYVGETSNFLKRVYHDHFLGPEEVSPIKRELVKRGEYKDKEDVKNRYFKPKLLVQYVVIEDSSLRGAFEHFAMDVLKPSILMG